MSPRQTQTRNMEPNNFYNNVQNRHPERPTTHYPANKN